MTFDFPRRAGRARWPLWLGVCLLPLWVQAQTTEPMVAPAPTAADNTTATLAQGAQETSFDVELQGGSDNLRSFLLRHMELMRYRTLRDLDATELDRLLLRATDNLQDLLGTLGHFAPTIEIEPPRASEATPLGTVRIQVEPGPTTTVAEANLYFRGDIATNPQAADQRAAIERAWTLKPGQTFTQADWTSAKAASTRALTALRYPAGRVYNSLADIDPTDHSVRLSVEFDSGEALRFGELRLQGLERYDRAMVERLVRLSGVVPGGDFDLALLQNARQRIADSGYFDSVHLSIDPQEGQPTAPVVVQLREGLRQKLVLGVGGSTDSGARLSVEHTHHRVPGIGWRALSKLQLERTDQSLSTEWSAPVDDKGWRWITSAQVARQIDGFDTTTSQRVRLGQVQTNPALDRSFFLQFDRALAVNSAIRSLSPARSESSITGNYAWTRRHFDSIPFPNRGYGVGLELGAGTTLEGSRLPFGRTVARWLGYLPLGSATTADASTTPLGVARSTSGAQGRAGRLVMRLEGGAVWAKADTPVPETQLFLTGGDTSVRGYGLRDIGIPQADGGVAPGRYMALASVEWQRPVWRNGVRSPWETVLFVDAGAVAEKPADLDPRLGVGGGLRYNSPVGPLRLDIGYGVKTRDWRLHFNVGFSF
ncbi:MAG: BamA/TamA family outer membrane protein [Hydrogenophaga sp.]|nr:BamA/TamA family outer membrane protein [Hydrogenophaga sp.]